MDLVRRANDRMDFLRGAGDYRSIKEESAMFTKANQQNLILRKRPKNHPANPNQPRFQELVNISQEQP